MSSPVLWADRGQSLQIDSASMGGDRRLLAVARASTVQLQAPWFSIWLQVRGSARVNAREGGFELVAGDWIALDPGAHPLLQAGRGALVVALTPVLVALGAWFMGQERMTPVKLAGIVIAMLGCLTVVGNGNPLALLHGAVGMGEWLILGCALCWTAYTFIGRQATKSLSPLAATLHASLIGSLLLGVTALLQGGSELAEWSWRVWASVVFLAIGGTALAFTWFADGVKRLGASKASVFVNLVPVFAVLQAAVLLDERLGIAVLGGGLLVIAGVWLTTNFSERTA